MADPLAGTVHLEGGASQLRYQVHPDSLDLDLDGSPLPHAPPSIGGVVAALAALVAIYILRTRLTRAIPHRAGEEEEEVEEEELGPQVPQPPRGQRAAWYRAQKSKKPLDTR